MSSAIGSVNPVSDYVWEVEITNPQTEIAKFKLAGQDIDDSEHQVQIYRQSDGAVAFVPVTDVIILNGESFTKGVSKQLQWKVIPENATNQTFPLDETVGATQGWTAGAVDVLVNDYEVKQKGLIKVESSSGYETFNVGVIIPNGLAVGKREVSFHIVPGGVLQYDAGKDFVKVFTLTSPDTTPPPPSSPVDNNSTNVVLNYVGRGAGGKDQWSVNLIEVYTRPKKLYKSDSTFYKDVTNTGGGVLTYGDPVTGKTGVHWQANPMDELSAYWGGTSEGWIDGTEKPDGTTLGPDENTLQFFTYPAVLGTENTAIALKDRQNMAFAYYNDGTYRTYRKNFRGETRENFLGSIRLDGTVTGTLTGEWVKKVSVDDKFNATGEQFNLALPTDQGPLWLRLRMDYNDGTVGYWWKAVYLQEWFVFHPDMLSSYATDANGNVIIDVDLYATPYMTYRTK
jgi:hypothetical protein